MTVVPHHPAVFRPVLFHHWFFHPGWFVGFGLLAWLAQLALFAALIVLVVMLLRRDRHRLAASGSGPPRSPSLAILEERYARGEITREEFLERRRVLTGWEGPMAPAAGGPSGLPPSAPPAPPASS